MKNISKIEKMFCLSVCLVTAVLFCQWIVSGDLSPQLMKTLLNEREELLDDLQRLSFKIDSLREQLAELEDTVLKKNERLSVIESQVGAR